MGGLDAQNGFERALGKVVLLASGHKSCFTGELARQPADGRALTSIV
jgi:hypothetical protein